MKKFFVLLFLFILSMSGNFWAMEREMPEETLQRHITNKNWNHLVFELGTGGLSVDRILNCDMNEPGLDGYTLSASILDKACDYKTWANDLDTETEEKRKEYADSAEIIINAAKELIRRGKITTCPSFKDDYWQDRNITFYNELVSQVNVSPLNHPMTWILGSCCAGVVLALCAWKYYSTQSDEKDKITEDDEHGGYTK